MIVSFYKLETGVFTGRLFEADDEATINANTPKGCGWIAGRMDVEASVLAARDQKKTRDKVLAQLKELDSKAIRYLVEKSEGVIDEEGNRRLADIVNRKSELRARLNNG